MDEQDKKEAALRILLDLAVKVQTGEAVIEHIEMRRDTVCVQNTDGSLVYFGTLPMKLYMVYETHRIMMEERVRLEEYLKNHPGSRILPVPPDR